MRPLDEPRRQRIGTAGRAALAERMEWRGTEGGFRGAKGVEGERGVWGILLASWPKGG